MNAPILIFIFALAFVVTLTRGGRMGFATVYLPALILMNLLRPIPLPGFTDMTAPVAATYGILLGMLPHLGEKLPYRLNLLDGLVFAMLSSPIITTWLTVDLHECISVASGVLITMIVPYMLARSIVTDVPSRRAAMWSVSICALLLAAMAAVEARLWPYYFSRLMISAGLVDNISDFVYHRYGLFRARTTFIHPIDFGLASVALLGILIYLASTIRGSLHRWSIRIALLALAGCALMAISYTSIVAMLAGAAVFMFQRMRFIRRHVIVVLFAGMLAAAGAAGYLLQYDVGDMEAQTIEGSISTRAQIMQIGLPAAMDAGPFGYGKNIPRSDVSLASVDNGYLLAWLRYGYVNLIFMLAVPLVLFWRAGHAFRSARGQSTPIPLALLIAAVSAMLAGMYTVWFGFTYATLFVLLVGLTSSTLELYEQAVPARATTARGASSSTLNRPRAAAAGGG